MDGQAGDRNMDELATGGDCEQALRTLYYFLDGELTPQRRQAIQRHLDECSPCLEAFDFEAELKGVIARCCRDQVPEGLRQRVAAVLLQASEAPGEHV
jgi:mycothiol system anti-sigma-R factor